ncbi:hypothetical protein BJ875DRAFT_437785 [Amylocarpus encephaloides]|uniref:C3H1-type domain-containing protein n=1 Tax=Amylocarpus encephaloides TaxID=45428 RepID=A0A9P7YRY5_9HELO|nr:hypothetical protein BJ875DRAFT_437785 [Amylocarpus encephaloides]
MVPEMSTKDIVSSSPQRSEGNPVDIPLGDLPGAKKIESTSAFLMRKEGLGTKSPSSTGYKMSPFYGSRGRSESMGGQQFQNASPENGFLSPPTQSVPYNPQHPPAVYSAPNGMGRPGTQASFFPRGGGNSFISPPPVGVPLSSVAPGPALVAESQLDVSYGYALPRGDGFYTRLLPVDQIPAISGIEPLVGPEGLIILPVPRQLSPRHRAAEITVPTEVINRLQHDINSPRRADSTQLTIDSIVARNNCSPSRPPFRERREKIYCDKWIHEGVCSFTQMGCKFKHEMPTDKETQVSLGLNHGFPGWYRRAHAPTLISPPRLNIEITSTAGSPSNGGVSQRISSGSWRRLESGDINGHFGKNPSPPTYGPISRPSINSLANRNSFSALDDMNGDRAKSIEEEDDEEDSVTYEGRGRKNQVNADNYG